MPGSCEGFTQRSLSLKTLAHTSLDTGRGNKLVLFTTQHGRKTNEYFLQAEGRKYFLRNVSLEYPSPVTKRSVVAYVGALRHRYARVLEQPAAKRPLSTAARSFALFQALTSFPFDAWPWTG